MEKWIILIMQEPDPELYNPPFQLLDMEDLAVVDDYGCLIFFDSLEEASSYQEKNGIDGQCVELPMYPH